MNCETYTECKIQTWVFENCGFLEFFWWHGLKKKLELFSSSSSSSSSSVVRRPSSSSVVRRRRPSSVVRPVPSSAVGIHAWQTYAWSSVTHASDHPRSTEEKKHSHILYILYISYISYILYILYILDITCYIVLSKSGLLFHHLAGRRAGARPPRESQDRDWGMPPLLAANAVWRRA